MAEVAVPKELFQEILRLIASISQILPRDDHQAEHVIQFPERQQTSIRGDTGTVELQLEVPVKI
jgi:hypothetical protein